MKTPLNLRHLQQGGMANYDFEQGKLSSFTFDPSNPAPGVLTPYVGRGWMQLRSDGTINYVPQPPRRRLSKVLHRGLHCCLSRSGNTIRFTFKVSTDEEADVPNAITREALEASLELSHILFTPTL